MHATDYEISGGDGGDGGDLIAEITFFHVFQDTVQSNVSDGQTCSTDRYETAELSRWLANSSI